MHRAGLEIAIGREPQRGQFLVAPATSGFEIDHAPWLQGTRGGAQRRLVQRRVLEGRIEEDRMCAAGRRAFSAVTPLPRSMRTASAASLVFNVCNCATSVASCSHSSTEAAPRDAASRPSAPVPAKASMQCQPGSSPPPAPPGSQAS